ncbi:MAG: energy transducer TonB [Bacteroidales bacterium]|nr:energy transducer TonB [Bacteroidales bacterium]MDD4669854.1 energy transducer TonB [Bacteroidales bacterium]
MSNDSQKREKKVGLYLTLSFHLILLIIMLVVTIHSVVTNESSFVLDFTKQEQIEEEQKVIQLKEEVSRELDAMLSTPRSQIRNIAIDANVKLKDDRSKNPNEVYDQARELQRKLDKSKSEAFAMEEKNDETVDLADKQQQESDKEPTYRGPSVISYKLDGRKAQYLPVPAYKGYGSGDVVVEIIVNQKGRVIQASVMETISSPDKSLHEFAIEAAKRSRFGASSSAPSRQSGEIVYRFIAQ